MSDAPAPGPLLIIHSSDEWYGADRMVAELAGVCRDSLGVPVEVWLPLQERRPQVCLSAVLERRLAVPRPRLPILRHRSLTPAGEPRVPKRRLA